MAEQQLAGRAGAVVALNPQTGAVKVMYANPSYNDNATATGRNGGSTFNSAIQAGYPPGSTFKIVTATAGDRQRPVHAELDRQRQVSGHHLRGAAVQ